MVELSIIIPVYNEEKNIFPLYRELKHVLEKLNKSYEIIFVNDGSTDKTEDILKSIKDSNLKTINFRKNFGQTAALDAGFKSSQGEIIITLDGDLQNDPKDIPRLISKLEEGYDIVAGWRHNRKDNLSKRFISSGARFLRKLILGDKLKDSGCTLRAYRKECIKELELYGEMHRFIHIILAMKGFKIAQIKVNHRKRIFGKTKYNLDRTFKSFLDMILLKFWMKYSLRPIHLFGGVGLIFSTIGILVTTYLILLRILNKISLSDKPLFIISIFMIIIGIQFLMFGVMSDILIKIYYKDKNNYSIKK